MPLAIENLAALARRRDGAQLLPLGPRNEVGVTENLQVDKARFDGGRPDEQANGGNDESALQRRAPGVGRRLGHVDGSLVTGGRRPTSAVAAWMSRARSPSHLRWPARPSRADWLRAARCAPAIAACRSRGGGDG